MTLQPLRRDPALVPLSHDHHDGLVAAFRLKSGKPAFRDEPDPMASVRRLWVEDLCPHFDQEESVLFSREWPADVGAMVERALEEHRRIRGIVAAVEAGDGTTTTLRELGELLEGHIRFEERQLFGAMQDLLTASELDTIGSAISAMRHPKVCRTKGGGS